MTEQHISSYKMRDLRYLKWWMAGLSPRAGFFSMTIDAYALLPLGVILYVHVWEAFVVSLCIIGALVLLELIYKYSVKVAIRRLLGYFAGRKRYVNNYNIRKKRFYSGE